jgi:hypothetical protein
VRHVADHPSRCDRQFVGDNVGRPNACSAQPLTGLVDGAAIAFYVLKERSGDLARSSESVRSSPTARILFTERWTRKRGEQGARVRRSWTAVPASYCVAAQAIAMRDRRCMVNGWVLWIAASKSSSEGSAGVAGICAPTGC